MRKQSKDYTGQRYGRLTVLSRALDYGYCHWICRCDCGTVFPTEISAVVRGKTVSCGCYRSERARALCSQNFRKCVPVEVTFPDGEVRRYDSANYAHYATGLSTKTVLHHIRTGKPIAGYRFKQL